MNKEWGMPTIKEVETEAEAREVAVNWQYFAGQSNMSYEELAIYQDYFTKLAKKSRSFYIKCLTKNFTCDNITSK